MTFMTILRPFGWAFHFPGAHWLGRVLSAGDEADLLLAFYQHSYEEHIGSLRRGVSCFTTPTMWNPKPSGSRCITTWVCDLQPDHRAIGGHGQDKGKNIFALGLIARIFDLHVVNPRSAHSASGLAARSQRADNAQAAFQAATITRWGVLETFRFVESQGKDATRW